MTGMKRSYNAPKVEFLQFDAKDVLATSNWSFECQQYGQGDNAAPPACDVEVITDNSENS